MNAPYADEAIRSSGAAYLRVNTRVVASGAAIDFTASHSYEAPPASLMVRSIAALSAAASAGLPVLKVTPGRSLNVQVKPLGEDVHDCASSGMTFLVALSYRVSCS